MTATTTVSDAVPAGTASNTASAGSTSTGQNSSLKWLIGAAILALLAWFALGKPGLPAVMGGSPPVVAAPVVGGSPPATVAPGTQPPVAPIAGAQPPVASGKQVNHMPGMSLVTYNGTPVTVICDPQALAGIAYSNLGGVATGANQNCGYLSQTGSEAAALAAAVKAAAAKKLLDDAAKLVADAEAAKVAKAAAEQQTALIAAAIKAAMDAQKTTAAPAKVSQARPAAKPAAVPCTPCAAKAA